MHVDSAHMKHWGTCFQGWNDEGYGMPGNDNDQFAWGENGAAACLQHTAGIRLNHIFNRRNIPLAFALHPNRRPTDSQVRH